ncbi:hypothetical protein GIB67_017777 [Kingdonia uniflora]|uniref:Uncharacterized protein n=1 Tax=Kingdonia uniflora TaxID=39325 RepID=A0A7J7MP33_9MAGN|nr:hypothetical protein GIB67_017777 [Kingdonia uniflora]
MGVDMPYSTNVVIIQLSEPATNYPSVSIDIVKGYSVGHPPKIILVLTQELVEITALVTESTVVQLKAFNGAIVSDDNNLSDLNVEKTKLLQKILVYVVSVICSFVDLNPNVYERAQVYTNTVESFLPSGDAYTTNPSSSGKDHVFATGLHWHQKAIISVMEAGGLTWLVGKHIKPMSNMKIVHFMELPPVVLTCGLSGYGSKEIYYSAPLMNLWMKQVYMEKHMANPENFEFPVTEATMMATLVNSVTFGSNERSIPSSGFGNGFLLVELEVQQALGRSNSKRLFSSSIQSGSGLAPVAEDIPWDLP